MTISEFIYIFWPRPLLSARHPGTISDEIPECSPLIEKIVADLSTDLQHLGPTDRRRLKIAAMITVLEDRIAHRAGKTVSWRK